MERRGPVIDMWAPIVPSREIMEHMAGHFPEPQPEYLRVFQGRAPDRHAVAEMCRALVRDDAAVLEALDEAGITRALITGFDEASTGGTTFVSNESVAAIAGATPSASSRSPASTSCAVPKRSRSSSTGSGNGGSGG